MQAPEAAHTEYEKNSHAQPFERLSDDFTFQMSGWWSCCTRSPARTSQSAAALRREPT